MAHRQVLLGIFPAEGVSRFLKRVWVSEWGVGQSKGGSFSQDCGLFLITVYSVLAALFLESGREGPEQLSP